jgi:beta-xylosidase
MGKEPNSKQYKSYVIVLLAVILISWKISDFKMHKSQVAEQLYQADPTIFYDEGIYYLYGTSSDKGFMVYQSKDLKSWSGPVGKKNGFALAKGDAFGDKGFWAPQVFKYKNTYFMAYTANEQIAIAQSNHPLGPFTQQQLRPISGTGKQIDPFVFFDTDGKPYLYHVKLQEGNRIFVSEMKMDLQDVLPGKAQECISGTAKWENTEHTSWPVTEGPTVFKKGRFYYLLYSANDFRNKDYAVGYATSLTPRGPWSKYKGSPIISRSNLKYNGTGHGDLFKDKSGNYGYVMHTHYSDTQVSPRKTGIVAIRFTGKTHGPDLISADSSSFHFISADPRGTIR